MAGTLYLRQRKVRTGAERLDRHPGSGRVGTPKKGGGGGKHTWGRAGQEMTEADSLPIDRMDPNYLDVEEEGLALATVAPVNAS